MNLCENQLFVAPPKVRRPLFICVFFFFSAFTLAGPSYPKATFLPSTQSIFVPGQGKDSSKGLKGDEFQEELVLITDISTIRNVEDAGERIERLKHALVKRGDRRGLFAALYSPIIDRAIESLHEGRYQDQENASLLIQKFAERFLRNFHHHLRGQPVEVHWDHYFKNALDPEKPGLQVALSGVNAHLTIDLPRTVSKLPAMKDDEHAKRFKKDYLVFGDVLSKATPDLIQSVKESYNIDPSEVLGGFFIGRIFDRIAGDGQTTQWAFQTIRHEAWRNGRLLTLQWVEPQVNFFIEKNWQILELALLFVSEKNDAP